MDRLQVGALAFGRYDVLRRLAQGFMWETWLAYDKTAERMLAIRVTWKHRGDENTSVLIDTLKQEATIQMGLDHPSIQHVIDVIDEENALYVMRDYVTGKSLSKLLRTRGRAFDEVDAVGWGLQLCDMLSHLRIKKQVLDCSLQPNNLLLRNDGIVMVMEPCLVPENLDQDQAQQNDLAHHMPGYSAPEVFALRQTDARSSVFSVGTAMFHLVTNRSPREFVNHPVLPRIRELNPTLSRRLEKVIAKATCWNPEERYQSAAELEDALRRYVSVTKGRGPDSVPSSPATIEP